MDNNGWTMTDPQPHKPLPGSSWPWILVAIIVVGVILASLSKFAAVAVIIVALVLLGVTWLRRRSPTGTGMGILSTNCDKCGGLLGYKMGLPSRVCPSCGHHQSWVP
jgi:ABC-type multidrug transport system permease subunit